MFSTILKEITGYLEKRFVLSVFLPTLGFVAAAVAVWAVTLGPSDPVPAWTKLATETKALLIVLFLTAATILAYLLDSYLTALTRLFEGYWDEIPGLQWLGERRKQWYREWLSYLEQSVRYLGVTSDRLRQEMEERRDELSRAPAAGRPAARQRLDAATRAYATAQQQYDQQFNEMSQAFPPATRPAAVLPTRLGNILKSAELYPQLRYHAEAIVLWPRLVVLLEAPFEKALGEAGSALDQMLVLTALSGAFGTLGGLYLLALRAGWPLFLAVFWGGLSVSWLSYKASLQAALAYSQLIKSAFDLHRGAILQAMGLKSPKTLLEERELWDAITLFFYRNDPESVKKLVYAAADAPATDGERAP